MQKLHFESAWDKTLSVKDRERIQQVFLQTNLTSKKVEFTPLWEAMNHRGELLITVLVQNFSDQIIAFHNEKMQYWENENIVAEHIFTLPALMIEPSTSMPWTFIFPTVSFCSPPLLNSGKITIAEANH